MLRRSLLIAVLVLVAGIAFTAAIATVLFVTAQARDRAAFEATAHTAEQTVLARVETSIALLRGVAGLFASQPEGVTISEFRSYMDRVGLREQYPGLLGIGFTRRIDAGEQPALVDSMRAQGHAGFRVWPEVERDERSAIVFMEPQDERNQAAIGYDMSTHPVRREAMERARDAGRAVASGVVELVQEIDRRKQPGFLIYLPVYRGGGVPPGVDERREQLLGFAYVAVRSVDFLSSAFPGAKGPPVAVQIHHGSDLRGTTIYEHVLPDTPSHPRFTLNRTADVAGEPWTFAFRSSHTLAQITAVPALVAAIGAAFSLALAFLAWRSARATEAAERAFEREQVARSQAERANRMKDDFLATLSHEMRTPLNAIVGWAAVLRLGKLTDVQRNAGIEAIDRNAKAQARLIDDLLDMNRVMSGKLRMNLQRVDLAKVLDEAVDAVLPSAQDKGVLVEKHVEEGSVFPLHADPARLQQVVWNLLSNAVKFTPSGGEVRLTLLRQGDSARIEVADTGEGIAPEFLPNVFDRFSQGDSTMTRYHGGLGIGLAIVRELVVLHGGKVGADSAGPGRGSTFFVDLPLAPEGAVVETAVPATASLEGLRFLVVDDEDDVRALLQLVLEQRHARVHCAASATEALAALPGFRPHVLVSDIGMPGTNGYELMRRIAHLPPQEGGGVPAVALTAYAREQDKREAFAAGFRRHLAKPVQPDLLAATVYALAREAGVSGGRTATAGAR